MAALELLLFQARRYCSSKPLYQLSLLLCSPSPLPNPASAPTSPFLVFHRSLCSSSPQPDEDRSNEPTPIQAVSYPTKPKYQSSHENPPQSPMNAEARAWTREDIRYVKDVPKISPVSYPSRVAPLPEDRSAVAVVEEGEAKEEEKKKEMDDQLERETRRIRDDNRRIRWSGLRVEEERLPFPTLIKQEQKKKKVVYDLHEAIRLIKVVFDLDLVVVGGGGGWLALWGGVVVRWWIWVFVFGSGGVVFGCGWNQRLAGVECSSGEGWMSVDACLCE
ncbi:hypothetical protein Acr_23g0011120 [Actinidia rufa]|uniref:Uncharacterized protein n=1 Tax=Actinidia rufa TaxID=165716 RepID=A0A7J0GPI1_9ERIC|nr:hypothetical protein Acr_23g0011120 [Actinidia rufa]